jgi:hypothetical protein
MQVFLDFSYLGIEEVNLSLTLNLTSQDANLWCKEDEDSYLCSKKLRRVPYPADDAQTTSISHSRSQLRPCCNVHA